jgi:hypothetical protein
MKHTFTVKVTTPKNAGFSPHRIALVLKHLIQIGQLVCKHTTDDTGSNSAIEADALKLTISAPKPFEQKSVQDRNLRSRGQRA